MAANRIYTTFGRLLAAWIAVTGLVASEHHGIVKSAGLPVPGVTVTAIKGDKKVVTTTDEQGVYSFPDLADGVWTIEMDMLGFAKASQRGGNRFRGAGRPMGIETPDCRRHEGCTRCCGGASSSTSGSAVHSGSTHCGRDCTRAGQFHTGGPRRTQHI